jgi:hypothetical protein
LDQWCDNEEIKECWNWSQSFLGSDFAMLHNNFVTKISCKSVFHDEQDWPRWTNGVSMKRLRSVWMIDASKLVLGSDFAMLHNIF